MEDIYRLQQFMDIFLFLENIVESKSITMTDTVSYSIAQHSWTAIDGSKVETTTTFPPYKGIILGEAQNSIKSIALVLKDDNALRIDGRIQKASE